MFATRRGPGRRRAVVGAGALVAGVIFIHGSDDASPTLDARISGGPLVPAAEAAAPPAKAERELPTKPAPTAALPATIDLDKITLENDRYVVPPADGRRAELTPDPNLQKLAERLLKESRAPRGAIVAMAPDW